MMECHHCWSILPHEILINIWSFLPAKSIGQCRCVSKSWRAFLSTPDFIKMHATRIKKFQPKSVSFFTHPPLYKCLTITDSRHVGGDITATCMWFRFVGPPYSDFFCSCDGLVLAGNEKGDKFLINPTTREIHNLQFELPVKHLGLGYDSIHDDYKVVAICRDLFVYVYSVSNGTWKKCEISKPDLDSNVALGTFWYNNKKKDSNLMSGIFVQNRLHWIDKRKSDKSIVIAVFDVAEEKFHELSLPENYLLQGDECWRLHLKVLAGCLCMFSNQFVIWMMREYGVEESWMEVVSFDPEVAKFEPLLFLDMENLVLIKDCIYSYFDGGLVTYNLKTKAFRIVDKGVLVYCTGWLSFQETLVSPYPRNDYDGLMLNSLQL